MATAKVLHPPAWGLGDVAGSGAGESEHKKPEALPPPMLVCCAMPVEASDFHLEEYKALRKEIEWLLQDYRSLERNIAVVCGGLLAWLFEHQQSSQRWTPQDLAWIIPFLFAGLGSVRAWGIFQAFDVYHEYIVKIEEAFSAGM